MNMPADNLEQLLRDCRAHVAAKGDPHDRWDGDGLHERLGRALHALEQAAANDPVPLSTQQSKALGMILTGKPFVMVAADLKATGADFFTAVHGDGPELRRAVPHLPTIIARAFARALEGR